MKVFIEVHDRTYAVDVQHGIDLSIPLDPHGPQPSAFGLPAASAEPFEAGEFCASVSRGGSVNCFGHTTWPHGNGTHTETMGHVTHPAPPIGQTLRDILVPATLISVAPQALAASGESYPEPLAAEDKVVTRARLARALEGADAAWCEALAVRTVPHDAAKVHASYGGTNPPYFTSEAMRFVREVGVRHLLVDLPSVDREEDAGALSNHRIFWGLPQGSTDPEDASERGRTITEMIYASPAVDDGTYLLNLQVGPLTLDAVASRPILLPIREVAP